MCPLPKYIPSQRVCGFLSRADDNGAARIKHSTDEPLPPRAPLLLRCSVLPPAHQASSSRLTGETVAAAAAAAATSPLPFLSSTSPSLAGSLARSTPAGSFTLPLFLPPLSLPSSFLLSLAFCLSSHWLIHCPILSLSLSLSQTYTADAVLCRTPVSANIRA